MSRNRFCKYMKFNRSNLYYKPKGESGLNLRIMEIIDEYYLDHPTTGVKTMTMVLREKDYTVNEKRVRRLMRKMNLMAIYPRKCLSKGGKCRTHTSLPVAQPGNKPPQSGVEHRHLLHPDDWRLHVSLCNHRRLQPLYSGLETEQHPIGRQRARDAQRKYPQVRCA